MLCGIVNIFINNLKLNGKVLSRLHKKALSDRNQKPLFNHLNNLLYLFTEYKCYINNNVCLNKK